VRDDERVRAGFDDNDGVPACAGADHDRVTGSGLGHVEEDAAVVLCVLEQRPGEADVAVVEPGRVGKAGGPVAVGDESEQSVQRGSLPFGSWR
jgi:hypothetical protein